MTMTSAIAIMAGRLVAIRSQIVTFFAGLSFLDELERFVVERLVSLLRVLRPAVDAGFDCLGRWLFECVAPSVREVPETNAPDLVIGLPSEIGIEDFVFLAVEDEDTDRFVGRLLPVVDDPFALCCLESLICAR
jgi:hypothetical protein